MAIGKILIDTTHRAVPRRQLSFLFLLGVALATSFGVPEAYDDVHVGPIIQDIFAVDDMVRQLAEMSNC